jgi:hypothetical protein
MKNCFLWVLQIVLSDSAVPVQYTGKWKVSVVLFLFIISLESLDLEIGYNFSSFLTLYPVRTLSMISFTKFFGDNCV